MTLLGSKHVVDHKLISYSCFDGGICIISYIQQIIHVLCCSLNIRIKKLAVRTMFTLGLMLNVTNFMAHKLSEKEAYSSGK
jgi:hypothetical protein